MRWAIAAIKHGRWHPFTNLERKVRLATRNEPWEGCLLLAAAGTWSFDIIINMLLALNSSVAIDVYHVLCHYALLAFLTSGCLQGSHRHHA